MDQQISFPQHEYAGKKKTTRRERFLKEMEQVVPRQRLTALIAPHARHAHRRASAFAGIDLGLESVPDATTLLKFRRLLETHDLTRRLLGEVTALLTEKKLILREGTLMDATIIAAPPSTKNRSGQRDPEMHRTKKGQQWYFGMKAHIGADDAHGLVQTVEGTAANVSDISQAHALLHGEEKRAGADCRLYRSGKAARNHRAGPEDPLAHRGQTQPPCQRA